MSLRPLSAPIRADLLQVIVDSALGDIGPGPGDHLGAHGIGQPDTGVLARLLLRRRRQRDRL
jgi:hypothetical protein